MDTFAIYCELLFAGERGQRWRLIVGALNGKVAAAAVNVTINHEKIYLSIGSVLMAVVAISIYLYV